MPAVGLDWMIGRWCVNSGTCLDIYERDDGAVITMGDGKLHPYVYRRED